MMKKNSSGSLDVKALEKKTDAELKQMAEAIREEHGRNMDAWPVEVYNADATINNILAARQSGISYEELMQRIEIAIANMPYDPVPVIYV